MPDVDIDVRLDVARAGLKLDGGFVTTGDKAWFTRGDTAYAVPQDPWDKIVEARESGTTGAGAAPATPELKLEPGDWLRNVKRRGRRRDRRGRDDRTSPPTSTPRRHSPDPSGDAGHR